VRGVGGFALQGGLDDGADLGVGQGSGSSGAWSVLLQTVKAEVEEPPTPKGYRVGLGVEFLGDGLVMGPLGGM
jgi:hypothetical protein